jgi:hypothetical protein
MQLIAERSRCVRRGELHEIVVTDSDPNGRGIIDRVGFLGFVEVLQAGVIEAGDDATVGESRLGAVLGFDACHFPNHYNVLIRTDRLLAGTDLELSVGDTIAFSQGETRPSELDR